MRVLIIGASGFIGSYLIRCLLQKSEHEVINTYNARAPEEIGQSWCRLDITDCTRVNQVFQETQPDVVVLLAAVADVRPAEMAPEEATAVNVDAAAHVARLYQENDRPNPNTHYGWTKWQAELAVAREASEWSIIRTSLVYGWPLIGRQNVVTRIIDHLKNGGTYDGDTNTYRTPIYVEYLTEGIARVMDTYHPGICHIAGNDWMNMYEFACAVAGALNMDTSKVQPTQALASVCSTIDSVEEAGPLLRPDILGLDCTQTSYRLGLSPSGVISGLQEMLA